MNPKLERKAFVCGLFDLIHFATERGLFDDAMSVLSGARVLRPKLLELDWFEGRIAFKRKQYRECTQVLRNLEASKSHGDLAKAMIAACKYYLGDQDWRVSANEVLQSSASPDAQAIVKALPGMGGPNEPPAEEAPPAVASPFPEFFQSGFHFLRA